MTQDSPGEEALKKLASSFLVSFMEFKTSGELVAKADQVELVEDAVELWVETCIKAIQPEAKRLGLSFATHIHHFDIPFPRN